ncbi:MAG: 16S rRNA (cytidine(1402)-2'-O)-methyltransferase [Rhodobacteraceae bacterium]|jgi:16S rRNA (cytidine1402-2'-O)-methyltransferase|nr:16S rRNA (cytidine(1402)-2'-O)-methyltransferase [Paracoccaceae bacterium]
MSDPRPPPDAASPGGGRALAPGLHVVATPIGNARDITLRALDVLRDADVLAAEDTRRLRQLLGLHGIAVGGRPLLPYHDHNGAAQRPKLIAAMAAGRTVAYASDAGTPLVADPGYQLVRAAREAGHAVHAVPGASAVLAALVTSGLPSDRFLFAGFLPPASAARRAAIAELARVPATLVLFESPARVNQTFTDLCDILGGRPAALCRELTKRFEETRVGTLTDIAAGLRSDPPRGEIVILVDRGDTRASGADLDAALRSALATMRVRDAADAVSRMLGLPRGEVYRAALRLSSADDGGGSHE